MFWVCSKAALSHPVSTAPKLTRWVSLKSCFKSSVSLPSTASVHGVCNSQQSSILPSSGGAKRHQVQAEAFCSGVLDESIVPYTLCIHQIPLITPLFLWEDIVAHSNAAERKKKGCPVLQLAFFGSARIHMSGIPRCRWGCKGPANKNADVVFDI